MTETLFGYRRSVQAMTNRYDERLGYPSTNKQTNHWRKTRMSASDQPIVHTPGPWITSAKNGRVVVALNDRTNEKVATAASIGNPPVAWANAQLIALAPELLQACRDVLDAIEQADLGGEVLWIKRGSPIHESASDRLQDVIERATYEPVV